MLLVSWTICMVRLVEWLLLISLCDIARMQCVRSQVRRLSFFAWVLAMNRLLANHQGRLPRICLLYTNNVETLAGERGANYVRYLGLVSQLLHPLSVLLTIVLLWVLVSRSCWYRIDWTEIHLIGHLLKLNSLCLCLYCPSHEMPGMMESICLLETYLRSDIWSKSLVVVDLRESCA